MTEQYREFDAADYIGSALGVPVFSHLSVRYFRTCQCHIFALASSVFSHLPFACSQGSVRGATSASDASLGEVVAEFCG